MNKYQRQLAKEAKQLIRSQYSFLGFVAARRRIRFFIKHQIYSPCEDCDNPNCSSPKNKLFYCRYNR